MSVAESTIGDVAEFVNGMAFKPSHWESIGRRIIRIQNLNDSSKPYNRTTVPVEKKYIVEPGDLLVSWSASLGVFTWNEPDNAVLNQHIFRVRPDLTRVDKSYFRYALDLALTRMSQFLHGSTMKHVNRNEFLGTKIPLPPLEEQRHIAAILDKADAVRRKRQEAIALTEELLRSAFLEMFGDPVTNPKGWEMATVGDVVSDVRDGPHVSPEYSDEGIPILSTRNIRPARLVMEDMKYVSEKTYSKLVKQFKPQHGDVLLTKGGTTGFAKAVDWDWSFAIWVHLAALRPTKRIRPEFLEAALNSPSCYKQSQLYTHGIANRDLGLSRIRKIQLSLPPLHLQEQYCNLRQRLSKQLATQENSLSESDHLFNSLLQRAFRGEL